MDFKIRETVYLPVAVLLDDPQQIRPDIGSVADIEGSIKRQGILYPIEVRKASEEGYYYICEGNRRVFTARKIGLETVPAHIRDLDDSGARQLMMASDLRRSQPHVVVRKEDDEEKIVGGLAMAVKREKEESDASNQQIAEMLGTTSDTVGAYLSLFEEHIEIVKAVASGKLAITAYSRMKRQPEELKLKIIGKDKDSISANDVREEIKRQRRIGGDADAGLPYFGGEVEGSMLALTQVLGELRKLQGASFTNEELAVLEMIAEQTENLIESN